MSDAIVIDPNRGYVALPASIFDLEISPGAFRTLSVLCNLSNEKGHSWASLEQLAEWVKRGKSSISGYLKELAALGLIKSEHQKRSNGANYRLKIRVSFWENWVQVRGKKRPPAPQSTECRVQPAERPNKDKNKPIETQNSKPAASRSHELIFRAWQDLQKNLPFGEFRPADKSLVASTRRLLQQEAPSPALSGPDLDGALRDLWDEVGVQCSDKEIASQMAICPAVTAVTADALKDVALETWRGHWKRPPTADQFKEMLSQAKKRAPQDTILRIIADDYRRYSAFSQKRVE